MKPESRAAQARQADLVLRRLLRTPKTRPGLIAAVTSRMISRRFVFGWLTESLRTGLVVELKGGTTKTYQIKGVVIAEAPRISEYPSWLDPQALPQVMERTAYIDGRRVIEEPKLPRKRRRYK